MTLMLGSGLRLPRRLKDATAFPITTRVVRAAPGHFGVTEPVSDGVFEIKLNFVPRFRVYYAIQGQKYFFSWAVAQRTSNKTTSTKPRRYGNATR
ncbi:hypothetical protein QQF68_26325 [Pseudomonas syringae pv. antirrhini str. 126]|nr:MULTISPECIES: hypothetical protein [Pseudomonas]WIN07040.1 hypothetical protein QQF68_26325 [Pseudomonas syringae pv. antirrhini str. 126]